MENILPPSLSAVCDPEFFEFRALLLMFILKNFCIIQDKDKQRLKEFMTKIQVNGSLTFNPIPTATSPQCLQFQRSLERALEEVGSCGCDSFFDTGLKQPPCQQTAQTKSNPLKNSFSSFVRTFEPPLEPSMPSRYVNEFEELGFIGKGGFGSVVKAKNKIDGSLYAIKKIKFRDFPPILDDGATRKKKFGSKAENVLREVTALAKLDHPNVARYYTAWIEKDCKFSNASSKRNYFFSPALTLPHPQKKQSSSGSESSVKNGSNLTSYTNTNTKTFVSSKNTPSKTDNDHNNNNNHNDSYNENNSSSFSKVNDKSYDGENSDDEASEEEEVEDGGDVIEFGDTFAVDPNIVKEPVVLGKLWQNDSSLVDSKCTSIANTDTTVQKISNINETNSINEIERSNTFSLIPYGGRNMLLPQISSPSRSQSSPTHSLHSPPTPHSVSKDRYTLFIQMQLYSSLTLKDFLEQPDRVIDRQHNLFLLRQLIDGLHHIHSKKFIHRDLKPANIFIDQEGGLRIGDFGLSKEFWGNVDDGEMDTSGFKLSGNNFFKKGKTFTEFTADSNTSSTSNHTAGIGTKSYASPEQTLGHFYSTKSDIYSLGIILVELYSLFGTASERACVLLQARKGVLPERMTIKYPLEAALAQKMLQLDPKDRPSTEQLLVLETLYPSPLKSIFTEDLPKNSSAIISVQKPVFYDDSNVEIYGFSKSMGELILKQVIHAQKIEIQMLRMLVSRCTCQFHIVNNSPM